jgi:surface antigen
MSEYEHSSCGRKARLARILIAALVLALAGSYCAATAASAYAAPKKPVKHKKPKKLPVRVSTTVFSLSGDTPGLRIDAKTQPGARCALKVRSGLASASFPAAPTDKKGRLRWRWTVPKEAPGGAWAATAKCTKGSLKGTASAAVLIVKQQPPAPVDNGTKLVEPGSLAVGGGGGTTCWQDGSSNTYCAKQCTWYVKQEYPEVPTTWGDAGSWDDHAVQARWDVGIRPRVGAIAVWNPWPGVSTGHVAIVDAIDGSNIHVKEYNWSCSYCFGTHWITSGARYPNAYICPAGRCTDGPPQTSNIRVYANNPNDVTAGDSINVEVVLHYDGPVDVPCGYARLGSVGDAPVSWADRSKPDFPNGTFWQSATRVVPHGCNGSLHPGEDAHYTVMLHVPLDAQPGVQRAAHMAFVHDGRGWAPQEFDLLLRVAPAMHASPVDRSISGKVTPGSTGNLSITMRNDGKLPWKRGEVALGTSDPQNGRFEFADSSWGSAGNRVQLREEQVPVGGVGHFDATYRVPPDALAGCRPLKLGAVYEGHYWIDGAVSTLEACVADKPTGPVPPPNAPEWKADYVGQQVPAIIEPGKGAKVSFTVKNAGRRTWDSSVRLGSDRPQDAAIKWAGEGVVGGNRVNFVDEDGDGKVSYGEKATFSFRVDPPASAAGVYKQYFALVNDNGGPWFFNDAGMYAPLLVASPTNWPSEIKPQDCTYKIESQDPPVTVSDGHPAQFTWVLRNTSSNCPWFRSGGHPFRLGTDNPRDGASLFATADDPAWIGRTRVQLKQDAVAPGETGTFTFTLTKPQGMTPTGDARLYMTPVIDGFGWLQSIGAYAPIAVR